MMTLKVGQPMGGGNPPGEYQGDCLDKPMGGAEGHFTTASSYRGGMHVGVPTPKMVGNQPQQDETNSMESFSMKEKSI